MEGWFAVPEACGNEGGAALAAVAGLADFLESRGLGVVKDKILDVTGAESFDDLRLLDEASVEEAVRLADLKLVAAKKFRMAVAELRGGGVSVGPPAECGSPASMRTPASPADVEVAPPPPVVKLEECIVACIDRSGSMGTPFTEVTLNVVKGAVAERTRMEAVKAMFYAFRDRVESLAGGGSHELGLVQFDDRVERLLDLTPRLDRFEAIVDDMEKRGSTAIYSSIIEAAAMLEKRFPEDSQVDLRVLVLTDGQNNRGARPEEALAAVNRIGAVVDAIVVGSQPDSSLRRIVSATGGECYQIGSLGEGFELLEAEGVVSLRARRGDVDKPPFEPREMVAFDSIAEKAMTQGGQVRRAPAVAAQVAVRSVTDLARMDLDAPAKGPGAARRIAGELKKFAEEGGAATAEGLHIFPAPEDLATWRVLLEGPAGSPFEGGVFALLVRIPADYPFKAPKIVFETPVYHCNVSDSGNICLGVLQESWSPALSVPKCLETIRSMLKSPNTDDALRQWIAELTIAQIKSDGADARYHDEARKATARDASRTVVEWRQEWGC